LEPPQAVGAKPAEIDGTLAEFERRNKLEIIPVRKI
jgi:hypothetical protein